MSKSTLHVVARFSLLPDKLDEFIRETTRTLVEPTLAEPGCIRYELCQDLTDPTRFAMIEAWESDAALERHLAREDLRETVTRLAVLSPGIPEVSRFRKV